MALYLGAMLTRSRGQTPMPLRGQRGTGSHSSGARPSPAKSGATRGRSNSPSTLVPTPTSAVLLTRSSTRGLQDMPTTPSARPSNPLSEHSYSPRRTPNVPRPAPPQPPSPTQWLLLQLPLRPNSQGRNERDQPRQRSTRDDDGYSTHPSARRCATRRRPSGHRLAAPGASQMCLFIRLWLSNTCRYRLWVRLRTGVGYPAIRAA